MSYTYLQEQGEESSAECFSDIPASVLSRLNLTHAAFYSNGKLTESYLASLSGMTCEPSTENPGAARSMSSAGDSPVPTLVVPISEVKVQKENTADCGPRWQESFARFDPATSSWKTAQCSLFGGLEPYSETWPQWGIMLHGECLELTMQDSTIDEKGCGLLPTPLTNPSKRKLDENGHSVSAKGERYGISLFQLAKGQPSPMFQECLMDWPAGWTAIEPLATAKCQLARPWHGQYFLPKAMIDWLAAHGIVLETTTGKGCQHEPERKEPDSV